MKIRNLCAAGLVIFLAACGGGGSDSNTTASATLSVNADAAMATVFSTPVSFNGLSAQDSSGNTYVMNLSFTPATDFKFNNVTYKQSIQNVFLSKNGVSAVGEHFGTQFLYSLSPSKIAAIILAGRGQGFAPVTYTPTVFTSVSNLPTAGAIGASGTLATGISYARQLDQSSTSTGTITGNSPLNWSIEADSATTAFVCLTTPNEKDCFRVNSVGAVTGAKISVSVGSQTLTFR